MLKTWNSPPTNSSSWPQSSRGPAVSPQRVWDVLHEANMALGQAQTILHAIAPGVRLYERAQALRDEADYLAVCQRAIREVLRDLAPGAGEAGQDFLERSGRQ
jgi:hypothetical protein